MIRWAWIGVVGLGLACSATQSSATSQTADAGSASSSHGVPDGDEEAGEVGAEPGSGSCDTEARAVKFTTSDGVELEADFRPSGRTGGKALILLHMIPPGNDRTNFTPEFIDAAAAAGYTVLNVDRRGAGGSQGTPGDAYEGPSGRLDAVAAVGFLGGSSCAVAPSDIAIVGASNGTTTALDYTVEAAESERPGALVLLSPGTYSENQHRVADEASVLSAIPMFMGYPDSERAWPQSVRSLDQGGWEFHEYAGGQHGTRLFTSSPESIQDIVQFLGRVFAP